VNGPADLELAGVAGGVRASIRANVGAETGAEAGADLEAWPPLGHSAEEIADALGLPAPTRQQRAIIEAPPSPLLVVAGAGSGKTETMAARVVWLVANGLVAPDQVLGLTFTRKAATELSERITARLRHLSRTGLWVPAEEDGEAETLGGTPTVSTYHSYAGRLVREHALRLGYESDSRLLSDAAAWQYAAEVVSSYDGPMDDVEGAESTITAAVVDLAGEMAEHLVTPAQVTAYLERVCTAVAAMPAGASRAKDLPPETRAMRTALRARAGVMPLVERYLAVKRQRDAMDFADQMAIAARLATNFPDIGEVERQRFRAILLDEFQDTSEAQMELLRGLFAAPQGSIPVTAVGDPHQSIYGWRGASATTLSRFPQLFGERGRKATVLPLSTSWRNDRAILRVANSVAAALREEARVPVLELSASPGARPGWVGAARLRTREEEADLVAMWVAAQRAEAGGSAAILCRKRSQFPSIVDALERRGVPYEVVGLGGLLLTPEIEDIVALLHVASDPTRGDQLMRLLTGPLCRLGAADLDGLAAWAMHRQVGPSRGDLRRGDRARKGGAREASFSERPTDPTEERREEGVDRASLVEALDELPPQGWRSWDGRWISPGARARLVGLSDVVRQLRALSALPLADLVGEAERALGLDIEVLSRPGYTPAAARAHLDAFADVAAGFTVSADRPTLGGFLSWLTAALSEERGLDKGYIEASPDAVQVLTVHAAKGLEWDAVAVPGLVEGSFPALSYSASRTHAGEWVMSQPKDRGWIAGLRDGGIPYALRGDRDGLPLLDWETAADWTDIERRVGDFLVAGGAHGIAEERRLAYVAFTRARGALLLTAPIWTDATTPRITSRFLTEVLDGSGPLPDDVGGDGGTPRTPQAAGLPASDTTCAMTLAVQRLDWAPMPDPDDPDAAVNPRTASPETAVWPHDPLAARRRDVKGGAAQVRAALTRPDAELTLSEQGLLPLPGNQLSVLEELELLLTERSQQRERREERIVLPRHLSTSAVVALAQDPQDFAMAIRRPMPVQPAPATRRGTAFHAWVEQHYRRAAMVDILDLPGSADEDAHDDAELPAMKDRFLDSEWADRVPVDVETSLETVIDGIAVRGRIDAVFPREDGGFTIVDWKTGPEPSGAAARLRALQLAAYRIAYARLRGLRLDEVGAAFYYAGTGRTVWPDLPDEEDLAVVLSSLSG
jgi:DNA helicase-2/ATP-dependent DNA helicase PcrA